MISEQDLTAARTAWGDALVAISKAYEEGGIESARALAVTVIDTAYGYNLGPVLFKPTLSGGEKTFRTTKEGCLSYFVGHDADYPQDGGFGIKGWREVRSETAASFIDGNTGIWMGWMFFTDKDGNTIKVDKTFGYSKDADGAVRIVLHHSSLPFEG
ncbi:phosphoribosyl-AMP cyclohydrolase [Pacificoceanicola onchidii]|uniref:phosphoribosyl-AMP cyclohydrolase n=1 Tax=Pacificoceanicola onchidii TaxID=2562685 RepID=UPI0010A534E1|nr:phosphoribosyl-AMP cyclohydrolase [Pacificoceanicola onchidii]